MSDKKITVEEVRRIAKLARLALSDAECEKFTGQLQSILEYVEKLKELDLENVEPTSHNVSEGTLLRDDETRASLEREEILKNAPQRDGNFIIVPKII
ncbi:MAG: Asp-tRNA(Asn)/Glu-tRNA(Gln) amidotransferase subunit GatC [Deltaproteobacteria bacterium]|nr:Asp-tRNA(Asn)/Glu-tRNA(Gln) amidotransferase subunit GatC [Deltaproteobacteria bacterium]